MVIIEEFLGFLRTKALNHTRSILCRTLYVKRYIRPSRRYASHEFSEENSKIVHLGELPSPQLDRGSSNILREDLFLSVFVQPHVHPFGALNPFWRGRT
jgi:hypothetical protein